MSEKTPPPNCLKCAYFKVTWEPEFPRACVMFGFKGKNMPYLEVLRSTGQRCPAFTPQKNRTLL
jgi:hypothetical protein